MGDLAKTTGVRHSGSPANQSHDAAGVGHCHPGPFPA